MYGKCTKKDAGISFQQAIASVNNMKINLDKYINKGAQLPLNDKNQSNCYHSKWNTVDIHYILTFPYYFA